MDNRIAEIYCNATKVNMRKLDDEEKQQIYEKGLIWKRYCADYSFDNVCNLIIETTRNSLQVDGYKEDDREKVGWFIGIYSAAAIYSELVDNFNTIYISSFVKYFNK